MDSASRAEVRMPLSPAMEALRLALAFQMAVLDDGLSKRATRLRIWDYPVASRHVGKRELESPGVVRHLTARPGHLYRNYGTDEKSGCRSGRRR